MEHSTMESGAAGSAVPPKFVLKAYHMVNDPSTDAIISWSHSNDSFIVKDPIKFANNVLNMYFNHKNFSSFIRQLNTYGFRKISHHQWEFHNEYFLKDQYSLLGKIHRKKPVHSHSNGEAERDAFKEEIKKLTDEKASIELDISSFRQKKLRVGNIVQRLEQNEDRHNILKSSFEVVLENPKLVEEMKKKIEFIFSLKFPNKRLFADAAENDFVDHGTNFGLTEVGNSSAGNDHNFELMGVRNDFPDFDPNNEFVNFGDDFAYRNLILAKRVEQ